jgi:RimJ/RimL family protein N-acetyltransferase
MEVDIRPATAEDLAALAALVTRANATYRDWAAPDWRPPGAGHELRRWQQRYQDAVAWNAVATADGEPLGCVSFTDARTDEGRGRAVPGRAHLSRLFVDPAHWGHGIGSLLLTGAVEEMRRRSYERAQLFTAAANVRSRRFYERHEWSPGEEQRHWQGLLLIRYSREL